MPHPSSILPDAYRPPTREQIERARAMYAQGFTVSRCLAATDMSLGTFYYWLSGGPQESGGPNEAGSPLYPPIPRRRVVTGKRRRVLSADRVSLAARLWRTAERQARDIEERLARPSAATPERERDIRMLGMVVRTLRDLDGFAGPAEDAAPRAPEEPKRNIDELRAELARRIHAIIEQHAEAARQAGGEPGPQEGGAG
jgi:hypothetical protein